MLAFALAMLGGCAQGAEPPPEMGDDGGDPKLKVEVGQAGPRQDFGGSVEARRGDVVVMRTRVTNARTVGGATVMLKMDKGPARTLDVTANVVGAPASDTVKIRSEGNQPIRLATPTYKCAIAPGTLCPFERTDVSPETYEATVKIPDRDVPIVLAAEVLPAPDPK